MQPGYSRVAYCIHYWLSDVFCVERDSVYQGIGRRHNEDSVPRITYTPAACDNMANGVAQYWSASNTSYQDHDTYFQDQYGDSARIMFEGSTATKSELWFEKYDPDSGDFTSRVGDENRKIGL